MRRAILILLSVLGVLLALGLALMYAVRSRDDANRLGCANNLRILARLGMTPGKDDRDLGEVWPGTVKSDALLPQERLSWMVLALPTLPEGNRESLKIAVQPAAKWNDPLYEKAGKTRLKVQSCPGWLPPLVEGGYAPASYVGIAGLGPDAATLPRDPLSPKAGAFQYDSPTPLALILANDGVSQTLLFGQTRHELGPWIRGGHATVRGLLDDSPILAPQGGQFGGVFAQGAYFAFADGSARFFNYKTSPEVLKAFATIAGGKTANFED
jgi:hypothetical protein